MRPTLCIIVAAALTAMTLVHAKGLRYAGVTFTNERYCPNVSMASRSAQQSMEHLATTGANYVAIIVTQYQNDINSVNVYPIYGSAVRCTCTPTGYCRTATDKELLEAVRQARTLNLSIMLKLQIDLVHASSASYWRGDIGQNFTDSEWRSWFQSYTKSLMHYAKIAEELKIELFSVSCELSTASKQEAAWRKLIATVRRAFSGVVTASANWAVPGGGGEVVEKKWWDAVDIIGVDEYYMYFYHRTMNPDGTYPSLSRLVGYWEPIEKQLESLHRQYRKDILFTEIGFCSGINGTCDANGEGTVGPPATNNASLQFQATQYEAALQAMAKYDWFVGVFWWNWATDAAFGGHSNSCMDPKFKPAEDVLRKWYKATAPKPSPPETQPTCKCWL